jgi:hypothetical protein
MYRYGNKLGDISYTKCEGVAGSEGKEHQNTGLWIRSHSTKGVRATEAGSSDSEVRRPLLEEAWNRYPNTVRKAQKK